jgi:hypothetical protein
MIPESDDGVIDDEVKLEGISLESFFMQEDPIVSNIDIDFTQNTRMNLEKLLGKIVFNEVYQIMAQIISTTKNFGYDLEKIKLQILKLEEFKPEILNLAIDKIPEFYSMVFNEIALSKKK